MQGKLQYDSLCDSSESEGGEGRPGTFRYFSIGVYSPADRVYRPDSDGGGDAEEMEWEGAGEVFDVRVLIDEAGAVVDLVVDDHVEVLLGVVAGDLLEGEFLGLRHDDGWISG